MYASIRRYRVSADQMDDVLHRVDVEFAETIQAMDGFVAYEVVVTADDELVSMSVFRDEAAAEASTEAAAAWVGDLQKEFEIARIDATVGEIAISRAKAEMLEPAHH